MKNTGCSVQAICGFFTEIRAGPSSIFRVFRAIQGFNDGVNLDQHRAFMIELAKLSGHFIRPFFGRPDVKVELKADHSPVTDADRGAEEIMRGLIRKRFPEHGVVGEEFGTERPDAEFVWVLDPIDGTKSFVTGVPLFGTLIGLLHEGRPVLGCIHQPVLEQLMIGDNETALLNGRPVKTRGTRRIEDATVLTSDPAALSRLPACRGFQGLLERAALARTWGDCYGYLLVASGRADVMYDPLMNLWDIAALVPVIRGAGGVITDAKGGPAYPAESIVAAANAGLHRQVIEALNP
jgi:histidinol phosphatase-like enzyme (inositol monophosphatase family)